MMTTARLDDQVVLISGAAGGIGAATARRLYDLGAHVVLADLDSSALAALAAGRGNRSSTVVLDVTDSAAYAASKAALEALANALRSEVAHQGVGVGVFHPGFIATPMVLGKIENDPAFNTLLRSLPAPLRKVSPVDGLADVLANAIAERVDKVIYPKRGWLLYALRPLLTTRLLSWGWSQRGARDPAPVLAPLSPCCRFLRVELAIDRRECADSAS